MPGLDPRRADVIFAGALILDRIAGRRGRRRTSASAIAASAGACSTS